MEKIRFLWPNGLKKAMTFSYDDGVVQDRRLIAIMRKNGLKGTFNLNSGFLGWTDDVIRNGKVIDHSHVSADEIPELYAGFEVAVHTVTHPDLTKLSNSEIMDEVISDRKALEKIVGYPVRGMAYPYGTVNDTVQSILKTAGILFSRSVEVTGDYSLPDNSLNWKCSCHHYDLEPLIDPFIEDAKSAGLLSVWGHSYEFDQKDQWDLIENQMERLGNHDDIWYSTNSEVFNYLEACRGLLSSVDGTILENRSSSDVWLSSENNTVHIRSGETVKLAYVPPINYHPAFRIWPKV